MNTTKRKGSPKMIITALEIQEALKETIYNKDICDLARIMVNSKDECSEREFARMLFEFGTSITALTATLVTRVCLTEEQLDMMMEEIQEYENLLKSVEAEEKG